jgi:hypothetical protein
MIKTNNVVQMNLQKYELDLIRMMAKKAMLGGYSNIRNSQERKDNLSIDQFIGQIGCYVGNKILQGAPFPMGYLTSRWVANLHPNDGDGGFDIPGANLDFKASLMRKNPDPLSYNLLVRPRERHKDWIYVLVLVENQNLPPEEWVSSIVHIVGWATDDMLPVEPSTDQRFSGAYVLGTEELHPFLPIQWRWNPFKYSN